MLSHWGWYFGASQCRKTASSYASWKTISHAWLNVKQEDLEAICCFVTVSALLNVINDSLYTLSIYCHQRTRNLDFLKMLVNGYKLHYLAMCKKGTLIMAKKIMFRAL